jgi:hypothetical protein
MSAQLPHLKVHGPDNQSFEVKVTTERVTVGRYEEYNDISLEPDPQQLVTRMRHCTIEREEGVWWVVDNGSVNKTFVKRDEFVQVVEGKIRLSDGDTIRILGRLTDDGDPVYWELAFHDPMTTRPADAMQQAASLEYDWIQAKTFRFDGRARHEIRGLRRHRRRFRSLKRSRATASCGSMRRGGKWQRPGTCRGRITPWTSGSKWWKRPMRRGRSLVCSSDTIMIGKDAKDMCFGYKG